MALSRASRPLLHRRQTAFIFTVLASVT